MPSRSPTRSISGIQRILAQQFLHEHHGLGRIVGDFIGLLDGCVEQVLGFRDLDDQSRPERLVGWHHATRQAHVRRVPR